MKYIPYLVMFIILSSFAIAFTGGDGTPGNPYQINNCTALNETRDHLYSNFTLTGDIDCTETKSWNSGSGFLPISTFYGGFNGGGYSIINLSINRAGNPNIGLFGIINSARISNIWLDNANITGGSETGALAGQCITSTIERAHSSGTVKGALDVGGLIGFSSNALNCVISNSSSTSKVSGSGSDVGGLVGLGYFTISRCYATGNVSSSPGNAGGLVGYSVGTSSVSDSYATGYADGLPGAGLMGRATGVTISRSYSAGLVGAIGLGFISTDGTCTNSYWDNETSGKTTTACGASQKSTAQMKIQGTYSGWNFNSVWAMSNIVNNGYPYLRYQDFGTQYLTFSGSTDFDAVSDKNNVTGARLSNSQGSIAWNNGININGADFDSYATIGSGFVSINASKFDSTVNSSVNVTFQTQSCNDLELYYAPSYYTTLADIITYGQPCNEITTPACTNIVCTQGVASAFVTFTIPHLDGVGGSSGSVPEFSTITTILALALVIGGFLVIRKRY